MGNLTKTVSIVAALFMTGCVGETPNPFASNLNDSASQKNLIFKTNEHSFMNSLRHTKSVEERNDYMDEFLLKSDMQCANFLNAPLKKTPTKQNDSLYMNIFDTASSLFGMSYITDTAKAVFLSDDGESVEEKEAYANALSPEIRKGVEIGRARYAKKMTHKKKLPLKEYTVANLNRDTLIYDKQCNDTYGLIEINRALKEMQTQLNTRTIVKAPTPLSIDPQAIKDKVTEVTKEVKEKEEQKANNAVQNMKSNLSKKINTPALPLSVQNSGLNF